MDRRRDKELIKKWSFHFADYLNPLANPKKGTPREFVPKDLSIFLYILSHWEEKPDIGLIKLGLNAEEYKEFPFYEIITEVSSFVMEPPEELNEDWKHGALRGTFGTYIDRFSLAQEYKLAGDILVESAINNAQVYEVLGPIIYNYRHSIELYLKDVFDGTEITHDLNRLLIRLKEFLKSKYKAVLPAWAENLILDFYKLDPDGIRFRYEGEDPIAKEGEMWVDVELLKDKMNWLSTLFQRIKMAPLEGI